MRRKNPVRERVQELEDELGEIRDRIDGLLNESDQEDLDDDNE